MKKYHYTYLLVGLDHRFYIGVRSCDCLPEEDSYLGSFTDKTFRPISRHIQKIWLTQQEALAHEIKLHDEFDVAKNPLFANRAKQTSIKFSRAGVKSGPLSEEHKLKISLASSKYRATSETKLKIGKAHAGKKISLETRKKISISHQNRTPEHRIKLGAAHKGKTISEAQKQAIAIANRNKIVSIETKARMSQAKQKYSKECVVEACKLLQQTFLSRREISKLTGLTIGMVDRINFGRAYLNITKKYINNQKSIRINKQLPTKCNQSF